jgi:hypothetical protein
MHPTLLERLKCEFENENNKGRSWVHSLARSTLGLKGCAGAPKWGLRQVTSGSIIHIDLHYCELMNSR